MATKKKTKKGSKKKSNPSKRTSSAKVTPKKKPARKSKSVEKSVKKRNAAPNKAVAKSKAAKKAASVKTPDLGNNKETRKKGQGRVASPFWSETADTRSGEQSGDLQGLSNVESADSESVDELIEEGNAFEAGVVSGVEDAGERGNREVRTREVPEDDVPGEYLDEE